MAATVSNAPLSAKPRPNPAEIALSTSADFNMETITNHIKALEWWIAQEED